MAQSSEGPRLVESGKVEGQLYGSYAEAYGRQQHRLGEALVRVGVGPRLEARIGLPPYLWMRTLPETQPGRSPASWSRAEEPREEPPPPVPAPVLNPFSGVGDLVLGVKLALTPPSARGARWALEVFTSMPSGSRVARARGAEPGIALHAGAWIGPQRDLLARLLLAREAPNAGASGLRAEAQLALRHTVSDRVSLYLEPRVTLARSGNAVGMGFGAGFRWFGAYQLDLRAGLRIAGNAPTLSVAAGVARRF